MTSERPTKRDIDEATLQELTLLSSESHVAFWVAWYRSVVWYGLCRRKGMRWYFRSLLIRQSGCVVTSVSRRAGRLEVNSEGTLAP